MFQGPGQREKKNGWENVWSYEANPTALGMSDAFTQSDATLPMTAQINVALLNDAGGIDQYTTTVPIFTPQPQAAARLLPPRLPAVQAPPAPEPGNGGGAGGVGNGWRQAGAVALGGGAGGGRPPAVLVGK